MQSHSSNKSNKEERPKLPWGLGSAARKGKVWWLVYRTPEGEIIYENSRTEDAAEAERILAQRALPRARAMVAALEKLADETATDPSNRAAGGTPSRPGRNHGKAPSNTRARKGTKTGGRK